MLLLFSSRELRRFWGGVSVRLGSVSVVSILSSITLGGCAVVGSLALVCCFVSRLGVLFIAAGISVLGLIVRGTISLLLILSSLVLSGLGAIRFWRKDKRLYSQRHSTSAHR